MQAVSRASWGGAGGQAGAQHGVLAAALGGGVDREAEGAGGAAVAEAAERDLLAAGQHAGDAGEGAAVADLYLVQLSPVFANPRRTYGVNHLRLGWRR